MNELIGFLDDNQKIMIGNELEKLFAFQDRPLSKEKKSILVQELSLLNIAANAIVQGIRSLLCEDLRTIKFATIREAAMEFIAGAKFDGASCDKCNGSGIVLMRDEEKHVCSLACICLNGSRVAHLQRMVRWEGSDVQFRKTVRLELVER